MEIKIVKNSHQFSGEYLMGDYVLETVVNKSAIVPTVKLFIYNISSNIRNEISPKLPKYILGGIHNISVNKENVYFITESSNKDGLFDFCLVRYNITSQVTEPVYTFNADIEQYVNDNKLELFILNDMYVLMQKEELVTNISNTYSGYFSYELKLYNILEDKTYNVFDENLNKNGIISMEAVSDTVAVMKTGFSLLPDSRYNIFEKEEVPVESISFVNIGQFISDIMIGQNNININIIDQAYFNRTFPYVKTQGDYIIYSAVSLDTKEEEVVFYNYSTKERKNCINKEVIRMTDLAKIHFINNTPYILVNRDSNNNFINLDTMKIDFSFDNSLTLNDVYDNIFILSGTYTKGIFKKSDVPYFEVYNALPKKQLLLREKGQYICSVYTQNDELYVFEK